MVQAFGAAVTLAEQASVDGYAAHRHMHSLLHGDSPAKPADLADVVHFLCELHGRHPGVIDHADSQSSDPAMRQWLGPAASAFASERAVLARLTVAAGPVGTTIGQDGCNAALETLRSSLEMLGRSERKGCAFGAACALVLEWHAIRPLLAHMAHRMGVEIPPTLLPDRDATVALCEELSQTAAVGRALRFGSAQLLAQHRGMWDLLEARHHARSED